MCVHSEPASVPAVRRTWPGPANLLACWLYSITNFKHNYLRRFPLKLAIPSKGFPRYCFDKFLVPTRRRRRRLRILSGVIVWLSHYGMIDSISRSLRCSLWSRFPTNYIYKQLLMGHDAIVCGSIWRYRTEIVCPHAVTQWAVSVKGCRRCQAVSVTIVLSSSCAVLSKTCACVHTEQTCTLKCNFTTHRAVVAGNKYKICAMPPQPAILNTKWATPTNYKWF